MGSGGNARRLRSLKTLGMKSVVPLGRRSLRDRIRLGVDLGIRPVDGLGGSIEYEIGFVGFAGELMGGKVIGAGKLDAGRFCFLFSIMSEAIYLRTYFLVLGFCWIFA